MSYFSLCILTNSPAGFHVVSLPRSVCTPGEHDIAVTCCECVSLYHDLHVSEPCWANSRPDGATVTWESKHVIRSSDAFVTIQTLFHSESVKCDSPPTPPPPKKKTISVAVILFRCHCQATCKHTKQTEYSVPLDLFPFGETYWNDTWREDHSGLVSCLKIPFRWPCHRENWELYVSGNETFWSAINLFWSHLRQFHLAR